MQSRKTDSRLFEVRLKNVILFATVLSPSLGSVVEMTNSEIRSQERRYQTEKIKFKNAETQDIFFASVSVAIV